MFRLIGVIQLAVSIAAIKPHLGTIHPALVAAAKSDEKNEQPMSFKVRNLLGGLRSDKDLPPVEVGVEVDFEINRTKNSPPKKTTSSKNLRKPVVGVAKKTPQTNENDTRSRLAFASRRIAAHKYAKVMWATLLVVWLPLSIIFLVDKVMGKEPLIDIMVKILPEGFPARYIEMAIEDGLWVGIFGVTIGVTLGTFFLEMSSLRFDVAQALKPNLKKKKS